MPDISYIHGDITTSNVDAIVSASNGIGYMGGKRGKVKKMQGIAESIQYKTAGEAEKEAKQIANYLHPILPGNIFYTSSCGLGCKYIIHAVTMLLPGDRAKYRTIERLIPKILNMCNKLECSSLAIPLLGTGTGRLDKNKVLLIMNKAFENVNIKILIYI